MAADPDSPLGTLAEVGENEAQESTHAPEGTLGFKIHVYNSALTKAKATLRNIHKAANPAIELKETMANIAVCLYELSAINNGIEQMTVEESVREVFAMAGFPQE